MSETKDPDAALEYLRKLALAGDRADGAEHSDQAEVEAAVAVVRDALARGASAIRQLPGAGAAIRPWTPPR